ncbi:MAG: efflux RND transporter periplasmic adaptor subunit [Calditrichaeota bacterium]|nr:efflux RND transporter periplasmic adaptor subunit [Calditrichota bacterium]
MKFETITMSRIYKKLLVLLLFFVIYSCGNNQQTTQETQISGTPVRIIHPQKMDLSEHIQLNANTIFLKKEVIRSTFQGFIRRMYKNIGDNVKNGDVILSLITKEAAAFDSLASDLSEKNLSRPVKISAHSNGVLTLLNFHEGDFVSEGEEIAVISNPSSLYFSLNVPYAAVAKISRQKNCTIFLPDGKKVMAKIHNIIPSVDPVSQTQTVLLQPTQQLNLPENLNVSARLDLDTQKDAVVVPRSAVLSNETQDKFWVMKLLNDSTALQINVQKGLEGDSLIQIMQPVLSVNDAIIIQGGYGLPDSARVNITE